MRSVIGVDPGINGAIARYYEDSRLVAIDIPTVKAKGRGREVNWTELRDHMFVLFDGADHAYFENVWAMKDDGKGSGFKFGYAAGGIRGLVVAMQIPVTLVTASSWKLKMGLNSDKEYSLNRACQLFPEYTQLFKFKKDHNKAEASLLAYHGYQELFKGKT